MVLYNLRFILLIGIGFFILLIGMGFFNLLIGIGFVFLLLFFLFFLEGDGWGGCLIIFVVKKV